MQFGDFINDMVVNVTLAATSATVGTVPAFPAYIGASDQSTSATAKVSALTNAGTGLYTKYTMEYVNLAGTVQSVGAAASNFVRYCEYPGERLFRQVKFEVNGNPLDNYGSEAYVFHQKFRVGQWKLTGWKRLMGQEVPIEGYGDLMAIAGATNFPSTVANLTDVNGAAVAGAPVNAVSTARSLISVVAGHQTPKATQLALDMWVPLNAVFSHFVLIW